jgi:hypothetical protein
MAVDLAGRPELPTVRDRGRQNTVAGPHHNEPALKKTAATAFNVRKSAE